MSGKRPPPSPVRQGGSTRPPPPVSAAPVAARAAGVGLGLKLGIGLGGALVVAMVLVAGSLGVMRFLGKGGEQAVASAENSSPPPEIHKEQAKTPQVKQPKTSTPETPTGDAAQKSPADASKTVPAESSTKSSPDAGSEKKPPATKTPPATSPSPPTITSPEPGSSETSPPATPSTTSPSSVSPLDDIRQRGNFLLLPEPKITERIELAKVDVAKPADCELTVTGADELLPMGQGLKLDRTDTEDKRTWTVSLKGNGALNKDRVIADFTFSDKTLAFQWRTGVAASAFPLHYCLLRVAAGGETETCRMAKPVPVPPAKVTPGETASIEMTLPLGIAQKM